MDARTGVDEAADLGFADLAGADHKATFAFELHKHWKQAAHVFVYVSLTFYAARHASLGQIASDRFDELSARKFRNSASLWRAKKRRRFSPGVPSAR